MFQLARSKNSFLLVPDWKKIPRLSDKLMPLDIMEDPIEGPLKPLDDIVL